MPRLMLATQHGAYRSESSARQRPRLRCILHGCCANRAIPAGRRRSLTQPERRQIRKHWRLKKPCAKPWSKSMEIVVIGGTGLRHSTVARVLSANRIGRCGGSGLGIFGRRTVQPRRRDRGPGTRADRRYGATLPLCDSRLAQSFRGYGRSVLWCRSFMTTRWYRVQTRASAR